MAKSMDDILRKMNQERSKRLENEKIQQQKIFEDREIQRKNWIKNNQIYEKLSTNSSVSSSSAGGSKNSLSLSLPVIEIISFNTEEFIPVITSVTANVTSDGSSAVTEKGVVFGLDPSPTIYESAPNSYIVTDGSGIGEFTLSNISLNSDLFYLTTYIRAYAINSVGVAYSATHSWEPQLCLAKGTKIMLDNGFNKNIEDIKYDDCILVWNFDEGIFDKSYPLWIKKKQTSKDYNLLKFSDGTELKTINQHRIFNKKLGEFTYPMTENTPIGTVTFNSNGEEVSLVSKTIVNQEVEYYNIITNKHLNVFANGILSSCRYNNIYPIKNMKFIKDNRDLRSRDEFTKITNKYFNGLRLSEQNFPLHEIELYINRLIKNEVNFVKYLV
jgi:hypothetical protein